MDNRVSSLIVAGLTIITEILCTLHPEPNEDVEELCEVVSELQLLVPDLDPNNLEPKDASWDISNAQAQI